MEWDHVIRFAAPVSYAAAAYRLRSTKESDLYQLAKLGLNDTAPALQAGGRQSIYGCIVQWQLADTLDFETNTPGSNPGRT